MRIITRLELVKFITTIILEILELLATIFKINKRGFIKEGYYADLAILDPKKSQTISSKNIFYKCGWSPFEGKTFNSTVEYREFVNKYFEGCIDLSKINGSCVTPS